MKDPRPSTDDLLRHSHELKRRRVFGWPEKDQNYNPPNNVLAYHREFFDRINKVEVDADDPDNAANSHWLWTGRVSDKGFPAITVFGVTMTATKFSWRYHVGEIPDGSYVKHLCEEPLCVFPPHLYLTDQRIPRRQLKIGRAHV